MTNPTALELMQAIRNEENILLEGVHGVGKTYVAKQAAKKLNMNIITYDAGLMDPYIDLLGIPQVIEDENGNKHLESVSKEDIKNVDIIIYDEFNRANKAALNGIMGLVQFHAVNGVPLPNLKSVIATQNPASDDRYSGTAELDAAIRDRFHREYILTPEYSVKYLSKALGNDSVASALAKWVNSIKQDDGYISPRRLEVIGRNYINYQNPSHLKSSIPKDGNYNVNMLLNLLKNSDSSSKAMPKTEKIDDIVASRAKVVKNSKYLASAIDKGDVSADQVDVLKKTISTKIGADKYTDILDLIKSINSADSPHNHGKSSQIAVKADKYLYRVPFEIHNHFTPKA